MRGPLQDRVAIILCYLSALVPASFDAGFPALGERDGCNAFVQVQARALQPRRSVDEPLLTALDGSFGQASRAADSMSRDAVSLVKRLHVLESEFQHSRTPPKPQHLMPMHAAANEDAPLPSHDAGTEAVAMPQISDFEIPANTTTTANTTTIAPTSDSVLPSAADIVDAVEDAGGEVAQSLSGLPTWAVFLGGMGVLGIATALVFCCCCNDTAQRKQQLLAAKRQLGKRNPAETMEQTTGQNGSLEGTGNDLMSTKVLDKKRMGWSLH
eukprot:TRINITY_DN41062_c0_g1_i1.p1 TRINITY_DN41062_c0_g1~~TRINITY_DN41062_c0_g1_i1.p1  ORF type:complete len:269 (-),score=54.41 TRINITY_DN41062_c0_g1_i1:46-852(-)